MGERVYLSGDLATIDGLSGHELRRHQQSALMRVRRGAWGKPVDGAEDRHLLLADAVRLQRADPVFSHVTAGLVWGLPVDQALLSRVWLTRRHGHARHRRDVREFDTPLQEAEVTERRGLPVTSVARTVVDLARIGPIEWGVAAADDALRRDLCTRSELRAAVARARGRLGVQRARRAVEFADPLAESALESISRVTFSRLRLPQPVLQYRVSHQGCLAGVGDFAWPDFRVIGECDGAVKYRGLVPEGKDAAAVILAEKRREERLREAAWWVFRWDWATAWNPDALEARTRAALRHGRPGVRRQRPYL